MTTVASHSIREGEMSSATTSDRRHGLAPLGALGLVLLAGCAGTAPGSATPVATGPVPVVLDVDMSSDDAMAIPFLVRDPSLDVQAVNVVGTGLVHCPQGMQFATDILAALGRREVPASCGGETPVGPGHEFPAEWRAQADIEFGLSIPRQPSSVPAMSPTQRLQAVAKGAGRPITVVATGPMTNLAEAFRTDPSLPSRIGRIVAMAGAVNVPGNVDLGQGTQPAEWNVYADPVAWDEVLRSGVPITIVPLDATKDVPVNDAFLATLEQDHAAAPADIVYELLMRGALTPAHGDQFWDPLAAVTAVDPSVVTLETIPLKVETAAGTDNGRTVRADDGVSVRVATAADQRAFEARFLQGLRTGDPGTHPFSVAGTMAVRFDGTTCSDTRPATSKAGNWLVKADVSAPATSATVLVKFHDGYGWKDLDEYVRTAQDPTAQPPFVDVPWVQVFEKPGSQSTVVTLDAGNYAFVCLSAAGATQRAFPAGGEFAVAP